MYEVISVDRLQPAADNVRRQLGDLRDLTASVRSIGIVEPLLVAPPADDTPVYTVVAGHRRFAAALAAELTEVPCTVRTLTDLERLEIMMVENLARSDLTVMEEASGYFRMVEFGLTAKDLSKRIGRPATHIKARLALLALPPVAQTRVDNGSITIGDATALLSLKEHPEVIDRLLKLACEGAWGQGAIERQVLCELARIEGEAKVAAAQADLVERGVPIVEQWDRFNSKAGEPVAIGDGAGELDVSVRRHVREQCHAGYVTGRGDVVLLCRDPARHRVGGDSKLQTQHVPEPSRTGRSTTDRLAERQRRDRQRQRRAFCAELLNERRVPRRDVQALVANQWIAEAGVNLARAASELLGIPPVSTGHYESFPAAIVAYADQGPSQRDRACFALALAAGDDATKYSSGRAATTHLAFITSFGWHEEEPTTPAVEPVAEPASAA